MTMLRLQEPTAPRPATRWYLGVDLGKRADYTALSALEYEPDTRCGTIRHLQRIPLGTPYTEVVAQVAAVTHAPAVSGRIEIVLDAGGVGEPVWDLFRKTRLKAPIIPVVMTGAAKAHRDGDGRWLVPKADIIEAMEVMLQSDPPRLRWSKGMPLLNVLVEEIGGIRAKLTPSGRMTFEHDEGGGHGDLAVATAMAVWAADRRAVPRMRLL